MASNQRHINADGTITIKDECGKFKGKISKKQKPKTPQQLPKLSPGLTPESTTRHLETTLNVLHNKIVKTQVASGDAGTFEVRLVPRGMFKSIEMMLGDSGEVFVDGHLLPEEWLKKYNCIDDGSLVVWFSDKGVMHRQNGPAFYSKRTNFQEWRIDGVLHRLGGPAITWAGGTKEWWVKGKRHRLDGPAKIWDNGDSEWWVNDLNMKQHANLPEILEIMGDHFYLLCINENPAVRRKALANPNCPPAWKIAGKLLL